jgi:hypothetical protein
MRSPRRRSSSGQRVAEGSASRGGYTSKRPPWPQTLALLSAIAAALAVALYMFMPPAVVPADAPVIEFSAENAMKDVRAIADAPHPMGSDKHEEVADYIVNRLENLGLSPRVQETSSLRYDDEGLHGDQVHAGRLKNIIARVPGTDDTGEEVLLMSHYDSMPTTPAADGGVSVATLLETVRAIQAGPPLRNDVVVYVGDADVNGVLGPIAFHEHPWSKDVGVGFAFEGIGPYGPSALVYEGQGVPVRDVYSSAQKPDLEAYPSAKNGWWLGQALEALPRPLVVLPLNSTPFAGALSPELGLSQVGTDAAGLGFGQFRGSYAYHTVLDNPERLEPRSLQHQGQNALSLARHFGDLNLDEANRQQSAPLVAFNVLPGRVASYPSTWALPLAVAIAMLLVVVLVLGLWRGRLKVSNLLLGFLLFVVSLVVTVVVTAIGWKIGVALNPAYRVWMGRGFYGADWRLLFLASLTVAFVAALYLLARRFIRAARDEEGVAAGPLVVLALLAVLAGLWVPSLSYLFAWPALAGVLVLSFGAFGPPSAREGWPRVAVLAITSFVPILLFAPPIYVLYTFLSVPLTGPGGPVPPVVAAFVLLALMLGALLAHVLHVLGGRRPWLLPSAFAAFALVFLAVELVSSRFDADHPRPDYVQYRLDAETNEATWISDTNPPDAWTEQFFKNGYEGGEEAFAPVYNYGTRFEVIRAPAPEVDLPAPRLEVLNHATSAGTRELRLRLSSPRGAPYAHLEADLPAVWTRASVDGEKIAVSGIPAEQRRNFALNFYNLPEEGIEITLSVRSTEPIEATLTDYSNGLPDPPGMHIEPRPPQFMPAPYDFRDPTAVRKSLEL